MVKVSDQRKSERVKHFFAETAKQMILDEGVGSVSVRKTAAKAGYSYATIYNHFENIDELLWYARELLIVDVADYIQKNNAGEVTRIEDVKAMFRSYVNCFIENPNVYHFFYFHKLEKSHKKRRALTEGEGYQDQFMKPFQFLMQSGKYTMEEVALIGQTILYTSQGLLTLFISDNDQLTKDDLYKNLNDVIDYLLNR
ncbi:MAG: TetR/AcrR family transcriptional regulator [Anaerolineaceae bacterium]|nr:TetR/AcrR family transcriptional regulator [Anaerolineaceae bacterium]